MLPILYISNLHPGKGACQIIQYHKDNNMGREKQVVSFDLNSYKKYNIFNLKNRLEEEEKRYSYIHCNTYQHRKKVRRIVFKSGLFNIDRYKKSNFHVIPDIVSTFVRAQWRWTFIYCFITYLISWLFFAGLWWVIVYNHGDLDEDKLPNEYHNSSWNPCVKEIYGFTSLFLFSIEIHTTVGYGQRILTIECPLAIILMCFEEILGTMTQAFIVGVVFAKLTRPKSRAQTLLFSKCALINQRDRNLCFVFRVANVRKSKIIGVNIHAYLIRYQTKYSDNLEFDQIKLNLIVDTCDDSIFMFPLTVIHVIDKTSPLYTISANELLRSKLEILVVLEGTIESTGQPVQIRSSYIGREILWGHRFMDLVQFRKDQKGYEIDYAKFNDTVSVDTPLCSSEILDQICRKYLNQLHP